ncbi:hypothetical protein KO500_00565 [Cellulophaga baltica]|uniref:hypothetical protein n=1 Tax=Cellulophaga TaxID=104264 RepID=UPI001C073809|nr:MULTISPECIES: hypothetical protein [Cellulophaga]MBU2994904.1 hypothetical protein [Cellulophaga baltica]MDO6766298.1 hypothetical protein [Cellulophaga sp. 1_MG-2023]
MNRYFLTVFVLFFLTYSNVNAQQEYLGVIKLNDSAFISYRVNFEILKDNSVKGYTVTNMGGAHETKSYLEGSYSEKEKSIFFKEVGVEYTKSDITTYDFCFVHFTGKLKNSNGQQIIEGPFSGKYSDGESCIDGEIMLKNMEKIEKLAKKADKKIQRSNKVSDSIKENISLVNLIDQNGLNVLKSGEKTTIFAKNETLSLAIWDAGKLDGDKISIFYNGKNLINNYAIKKSKKEINLKLNKGENILKFRADNIGDIAPNTAKIEIAIGDKVIDLLSNLNKGEYTSLVIVN